MSDESAIRQTMHDLNNALAKILTAAELIASEVPGESQAASDARDIQTAALDGRSLVQRLQSELVDRP
jgi:hypothetical protein